MNRKSNFIISIEDTNAKPDNKIGVDLHSHYKLLTGNSVVTLHYTDNTILSESVDKNIIILLSGNIYQNDKLSTVSLEKYLFQKYLLHKKDFIKYLNGSFAILFIQKDTNEIFLATDRLNSKKIFKFENAGKLIFSTDIDLLPKNECNLSSSGTASYLINGIMLNDLTAFEEIKKLERATIYTIKDRNISTDRYWDYNFIYEFECMSQTELSDELHRLYLNSISKLIKGKSNIYISLSGGYDSRGIAAMLKNFNDTDLNIICFSHNFGMCNTDTDSDIASKIAGKLGYKFTLLNSYKGNALKTIKYNAEQNKGLASFCKESDAWEEINKEFEHSENSILITGDMYDGTYIDFHGNVKRALEKARICEPAFIKEYKNYFSYNIYYNLYNGWENEYDQIIKKYSGKENIVNMLDYLYMDQLIPNLYSIARECFQSPYIETVSPYYDNDILDFIQKIPPHLRDRKLLHKLTLKNKYPDTFNIPFPANGWGKEPDWTEEIRSNSDVFIDYIKNGKSRLDEIISPHVIIDLLDSLRKDNNNSYKVESTLSMFHNTLKKIIPSYHRIVEIMPGGKEITRRAGKYVNPRISHPLLKMLLLRFYLSKN